MTAAMKGPPAMKVQNGMHPQEIAKVRTKNEMSGCRFTTLETPDVI
jgi:hypothetical protein